MGGQLLARRCSDGGESEGRTLRPKMEREREGEGEGGSIKFSRGLERGGRGGENGGEERQWL